MSSCSVVFAAEASDPLEVVDEPKKEVPILVIFPNGKACETHIDSDVDDQGAP